MARLVEAGLAGATAERFTFPPAVTAAAPGTPA
jgi:hypothetical protein